MDLLIQYGTIEFLYEFKENLHAKNIFSEVFQLIDSLLFNLVNLKGAKYETSQSLAPKLDPSPMPDLAAEKENDRKILNKATNYKEITIPTILSSSLPLKNSILKENNIHLQNKLNIGRFETFQERRKEKREFGNFEIFHLEEEDEKYLFDLGVRVKFGDRKNVKKSLDHVVNHFFN